MSRNFQLARLSISLSIQGGPKSLPSYPIATFPSLASPPRAHRFSARTLATHSDFRHGASGPSSRPPPSSSSSDLLDRLEAEARRRGAAGDADRENVGPFPLGVGASGRRRPWKSWSQLGLGGKLARTTAQTGNLAVILVGGGLFVILAFALTTELFAKNSPSVLYSQCIDMIRESDALNAHLLPPLSYTHTPHSSSPTRGSPPVIHRFVRNPSSGRDHIILTFWVHGRGRDEPERLGWVKGAWARVEDGARRAAYVIGIAPEPQVEDEPVLDPVIVKEEAGPGLLGSILGSFSALRTPASTSRARSAARGLPPPGTYKIGEVHADYVKNAAGQFNLLSLVIDVPSSRASYPGRATVFWSPEADTEGLLGRRGV